MALATWSPRRLLFAWGIGLVLQAVAVIGPSAWMLRRMQHDAPALRSELAAAQAAQARWQLGRVADAERVAIQRAATGPTSRGADGAPRYAVVRIPVGPDPTVIARAQAEVRWAARGVMLVQCATIPAVLLLVTVAWWRARSPRPAPRVRVA
jgi:hypothetical protein